MLIAPITDTTPVLTRDAVGLLTQDHRKVQLLFSEFELIANAGNSAYAFEIARNICGELLIHMAIEEAIFYPALAVCTDQLDLINDAKSEHDAAKRLIRHIGEIDATHAAFAAKMDELNELVSAHIADEESMLFPDVLVSGIDLHRLGERLHAAGNDMRIRLGLPTED
jgi:hemerythrin superfamily protein